MLKISQILKKISRVESSKFKKFVKKKCPCLTFNFLPSPLPINYYITKTLNLLNLHRLMQTYLKVTFMLKTF